MSKISPKIIKYIWRPIHEVIDVSFFEETDVPQAFLDLSKNKPN